VRTFCWPSPPLPQHVALGPTFFFSPVFMNNPLTVLGAPLCPFFAPGGAPMLFVPPLRCEPNSFLPRYPRSCLDFFFFRTSATSLDFLFLEPTLGTNFAICRPWFVYPSVPPTRSSAALPFISSTPLPFSRSPHLAFFAFCFFFFPYVVT